MLALAVIVSAMRFIAWGIQHFNDPLIWGRAYGRPALEKRQLLALSLEHF
jgi:hypothetical protein